MVTDGFSQRLNPKYHRLMLKVSQIGPNTQEINVSRFLYPRISIQTRLVGLHTADTFSRVVPRSLWCHYCLWGFCLVPHALNSICSPCEACCSLLSICQALSLSFFSVLLPPRGPPTVAFLPICSFTYLLLFLALGWWQSGIWVVCLLFHDMLCCVTAAAWSLSLFFLLLLHPGSQQTLTYVSASHVLISNLKMLLTLISSSPELFVTLLDTPKHPPPFAPNLCVSLQPTIFYHPSRPPWQDFLGQVHCTLGEIVGSPASRLEKSLGWVWPLTCPKMSTSHSFFPFSMCPLPPCPKGTTDVKLRWVFACVWFLLT